MENKSENMSFAEIVADYTVIKEEIFPDHKEVTIRTHNGYHSTMRIPNHTEEEKKKIAERFTKACIQIAYPDLDLSQVKYMQVIID